MADDDVAEKATAAEQIQGKWVIYRDTREGRIKTVKEHLDGRTVLTTYDADDKVLYSHRSEYEVDATGNVYVFRYRNQEVLVGPDAGKKDKRDKAYLFRIEGDRFFEVHGMLKGDTGGPYLVVWERLKD